MDRGSQKRILVVAHDRPLRESRVSLLESEGYRVASVDTDDSAMELLESEQFDLILLGHQSSLPTKEIDQRLRERFPQRLTLKIELMGIRQSSFPTKVADPAPEHVLAALREMLGEGYGLAPMKSPQQSKQPLSP